ncbi:hypothetical protein M427DRAFT_290078 [Gonapodya prolifera JEL478]|uniref:Uncharacterized protein n=1 Tax=Gonapodya prolifera (strain JEL478) TaxID=1344416 RepID=A0A139AHT2_GONPJ|nr:hypothetical protein M427DRAFT_290078 [Gonapodya prolifera JEL478]|eukprot:KXS16382.1 hypothetical protein M427DRAFT_290078 [Gonapodya prolifera JEL478]
MASLFRSFSRSASRAATDPGESTENLATPKSRDVTSDAARRIVTSSLPPSPPVTPRNSSSTMRTETSVSTITASLSHSANSGLRQPNRRRSFFGGAKFTLPSLSRTSVISNEADLDERFIFEAAPKHRHSIAVFRSRTQSYSPAPSLKETPARLPRRPASNIFSFASPIASALSLVTGRTRPPSPSPAVGTPAPQRTPIPEVATLAKPAQMNRDSRCSIVAELGLGVHAGATASSTLHPPSAADASQGPVSWNVGGIASLMRLSSKTVPSPAVGASAAVPAPEWHSAASTTCSPTPVSQIDATPQPSRILSGRQFSVSSCEDTPFSKSPPTSPVSEATESSVYQTDESSVYETEDETSTSDSEAELAQMPGWPAGSWREEGLVWLAAGALGNGSNHSGRRDQGNKRKSEMNQNSGAWESAWRNAEEGFMNPLAGPHTPIIVHPPVYIEPSYAAGAAAVVQDTLVGTHLNVSGRSAPSLARTRTRSDSPTRSYMDPPPPRPASTPMRRKVPEQIRPPSSTSPPTTPRTLRAPSSTPPVQLSAPAQPTPSTRSTTPNLISPTSMSSYATTDARSSMYQSSSPPSSSATAGRESRYAGDLNVESDAGWAALVMRELEVAGKAGAKKGANTHAHKASHDGRRNSQGFWSGHARSGSGSWGGQVLREMGF